jgi:glycosyltransferase involved in cell wall biosynthesis
MDRHRIGIVIPALNEEATIGEVVLGARDAGVVIVVDDGSRDATAERARAAGAQVVSHAVCRGYDQALNSGCERAALLDCAYIITMDADGQHDPQLLAAFIRALDAGADTVIGIRDRRQRVAESIFGWIGALRWSIRDPLCGMKAYRMQTYRELGHFDSYGSIGTELAIFAARSGKKIVQLPVKTRERVDAARFGRRFTANVRILRALWNGLAGSRATVHVS